MSHRFEKGNQYGKTAGFGKNPANINRKGRPPQFDFVRSLAQKLALEPDPVKKKKRVVCALLVLYEEDPAKFIEIAYGKTPDKVIMSGDPDTELTIKIVQVQQ